MKRIVMMALTGAVLMIPIEAEAQRARNGGFERGERQRHVVAPVSGRLVSCRAPADRRAYVCRSDQRSNVVYSYAGRTRNRFRRGWLSVRWGEVRYRPAARRPVSGVLGQRALRELVGPATVRRVRDHGRREGLRGPVRGRWVDHRRSGTVLTLTMEGFPVAELFDYNRDGFVDDLLLRDFRRW